MKSPYVSSIAGKKRKVKLAFPALWQTSPKTVIIKTSENKALCYVTLLYIREKSLEICQRKTTKKTRKKT
jgi:hypothetical protein